MVTITRMEPTDKGLNFEYCHDSKNTLLMTIRSISPYTPVIEKKAGKQKWQNDNW